MKKGSTKKWLLEANQQAECYKDLPHRIKTAGVAFYAFIKHVDEQDEKGPEHMHAVLEFQTALTFEEVQDLFKGAHLEQLINFDSHMAYLLHRTPKAREEGKRLYFIEDLFTNDKERAKRAIANGEKEALDPNHILDEIAGGCTSLTKFVSKFRPDSVKPWMSLIKELLKERREGNQDEAIQQRALQTMKELHDRVRFDEGPWPEGRMREIIEGFWSWVDHERNKMNH